MGSPFCFLSGEWAGVEVRWKFVVSELNQCGSCSEKIKTALRSIAVGRSVDRGLRTLVLVTKRLPDRDSYTLRFYHSILGNSLWLTQRMLEQM